ncbi:ATP-dependent Clp protease proteolytic subunit, partial [Streptomyces sp. NRRL S-146]|uniref:ATP-dependent Clp protease proteolytic subunit n=1 Tax=Streptomyces sp. NRRL S-146 TaxID=1463884 RepID=UPI0004C6FBB6
VLQRALLRETFTAQDVTHEVPPQRLLRGGGRWRLARHTHHDVTALRADMDRDKVFTAQEAVGYGLADEVLSRRLVKV